LEIRAWADPRSGSGGGPVRVQELVWEKCVLCTRCYCPFGIDIPGMIAFARSICRSQDVLPTFDQ